MQGDVGMLSKAGEFSESNPLAASGPLLCLPPAGVFLLITPTEHRKVDASGIYSLLGAQHR